MKKTFLFCTKIWFYLCEIPPVILLIVSIIYNNDSDGLVKLYPLIVFSIAAIILIFLYFFRMIIITTDEIKCVGTFASKDSAMINKDRALIFTLTNNGKLTVRLFGNSDAPSFNWSKGDEFKHSEIDLFREKAIGGNRAISKVLSFFDVPKEDISLMLSQNEYKKDYESYSLTKSTDDDKTTVSLRFTRTI